MPELVEDVKKEFDIVYTFDIGDAQKYGLSFYLEVCSKNQISNDKETPCDFLYIGTDRGRFKTIYSIFKKLSDCDGSCVFYVDKVLNENLEKILDLENVVCDKDTKSGEIHYKNSKLIFNKYVPYQKTLACIDSCKAMVEITFPGQTAGTMRLPESVIYNKKLITTCQSVLRRDFFNKNNILVIEKADDLTKENIDKFMASPLIATEVDFSPLGLIKDAKNKLYK